MSIITQDATLRTIDQRESLCLDFVKQEVDEKPDVEGEPHWEECNSNKFQNVSDESKNIIDQLIDENGKVLLREHFSVDWNGHVIKSEENMDSFGENELTCTLSKLEAENNAMDQEEMSPNFPYIKRDSDEILENESESSKKWEIDSNDSVSNMTNPYEVEALQENQLELESQNCHFCDFKSTCKSSFRLHIDSHAKLRNQKCQHCGHNALRKNHLQKLIDFANFKQKEHICQCSRISYVEPELRKHVCQYCNFTANMKTDLWNHMKSIHSDIKNHKCHLCEYKTSLERQLKKHINVVHLKVKNHKCHLCSYKSALKRSLRDHIQSVHMKLKNFNCHLCDYRSYHKRNLQEHIDFVHLKIKRYECHICDYRASVKKLIEDHVIAVHLKIKEHKCQFCDYNASLKSSLQKHMKSIHSKSSIH